MFGAVGEVLTQGSGGGDNRPFMWRLVLAPGDHVTSSHSGHVQSLSDTTQACVCVNTQQRCDSRLTVLPTAF